MMVELLLLTIVVLLLVITLVELLRFWVYREALQRAEEIHKKAQQKLLESQKKSEERNEEVRAMMKREYIPSSPCPHGFFDHSLCYLCREDEC